MIDTIRKILAYALFLTGITYIRKKLGNKHPIILVYHRVADIDAAFKDDRTLVSASVKSFERQMAYLRRHYNIVTLDRIFDSPRNSVAITFDDGYIDNYTNAYPIMHNYRIPATIYVATGGDYWWERARKAGLDPARLKGLPPEKIGGKKARLSMSWQQMKKMEGMSIQAHTHTHPILTKLTRKQAEEEIRKSKGLIEKNLRTEVRHFSYPNGKRGDFNATIKGILKKSGFETAVTYIPGWVKPGTDRYAMPRVPVRYADDMVMFRAKLIGMDNLGRLL